MPYVQKRVYVPYKPRTYAPRKTFYPKRRF